jgi:nucleoside-diphosphate-sugar epimerase
MARVIVTGGSGKVGRACIEELLQHGNEVFNLDTTPPAKERANGKGDLIEARNVSVADQALVVKARHRSRNASISSASIGLNLRAIFRFCPSTASDSIPLIVVATGRLIA